MRDLVFDLRCAARRLRASPGFTAIAVALLALGIGANSAIFSAVEAVLLRPLPYPDSDRLVRAYATRGGDELWTASPPDYLDWRREARSFSGLAATNASSFAVSGLGPAEQVPGAAVSASLLEVLRVAPALGRPLLPADEVPGGPPVALVSHGFWQRRLGGDAAALGRTVRLEGEEHAVVGIMPRGFAYPDEAEVWVPLRFTAEELATQRGAHYLDLVGRLAPGATLGQADRELAALAARIAAENPATNTGWGARVVGLHETLVGEARPALLVLLAAVGLVLLVACANLAGLLLARAAARARDSAVRIALGAGRSRLIREQLAETGLLAAGGCGAGLLVAAWAGEALAAVAPDAALLAEPRLGGPVLGFAVGIAALTALAAGLAPALAGSRLAGGELAEALGGGARASGGRRERRLRDLLVVAEIAIAVVLLAAAGLLVRSFLEMVSNDPGFDPERVVTFGVAPPESRYPEPRQVETFHAVLAEQVAALPGVEAAGAVFGLPMSGFDYSISVSELDGRPLEPEEGKRLSVQVRVVTPGFFRALGIPVLAGRGIEDGDRADRPPVVVVEESAARLLFPGEEAIGHRFTIGTGFGLDRGRAGGEVVGVVGDVRDVGLAEEVRPKIYLAHRQFPLDFMKVAIRTRAEPASVLAEARAILMRLDPEVPLFAPRTMEEVVASTVAGPRRTAQLVAAFAGAALALALLGAYGVAAHGVARRTREIGIRRALGARGGDVAALVLARGGALCAAGVLLGGAGALAAGRLLAGLLPRAGGIDLPTVAGAAALLALAVLAACALPARRASRIDPMEALRGE